MTDELISFQKRALEQLRNHCAAAHSELREKVAVINTNEELDHLFAQYGE